MSPHTDPPRTSPSQTDPAWTDPPPRHDHGFYVAALKEEAARLVAAVAAARPELPVPTCPGWTIHELAMHVGRVHRWAAHIVDTRAIKRPSFRDSGATMPTSSDTDVPWLESGARLLLEALGRTPGDTPMWSWTSDRHARFWSRRQLCETAIHRADAELALGRHPLIDRDTALDAIDELIGMLGHMPDLPAKLSVPAHVGDSLHLHATDASSGGEWMLSVIDGGFTWAHEHGKGAAAVRGSASDLLLAMYGRLPADDEALECLGDASVVAHWCGATAI